MRELIRLKYIYRGRTSLWNITNAIEQMQMQEIYVFGSDDLKLPGQEWAPGFSGGGNGSDSQAF